MMIGTGDAHASNGSEHTLLTIVYSCYAKLLQGLKTNGLMDRTLVVMFSEFDRTAAITTDTSLTNRGTGPERL